MKMSLVHSRLSDEHKRVCTHGSSRQARDILSKNKFIPVWIVSMTRGVFQFEIKNWSTSGSSEFFDDLGENQLSQNTFKAQRIDLNSVGCLPLKRWNSVLAWLSSHFSFLLGSAIACRLTRKTVRTSFRFKFHRPCHHRYLAFPQCISCSAFSRLFSSDRKWTNCLDQGFADDPSERKGNWQWVQKGSKLQR